VNIQVAGGSPTGPRDSNGALIVPKLDGYGILLKENIDVRITGCTINQCYASGIALAGTSLLNRVMITGCRIVNNNFLINTDFTHSLAQTFSGIEISGGTCIITGCCIGDDHNNPINQPATQYYGVKTYDGSKTTVVGCDLLGNVNTPILILNNASRMVISGNTGFISKNSGTATIPAFSSQVVVTHFLLVTPVFVLVTPTSNLGNLTYYVNQIDATTFIIHTSASVGSSPINFSWVAFSQIND